MGEPAGDIEVLLWPGVQGVPVDALKQLAALVGGDGGRAQVARMRPWRAATRRTMSSESTGDSWQPSLFRAGGDEQADGPLDVSDGFELLVGERQPGL